MSNINGKLCPRRGRSKLGPTRYLPRCKRRGCNRPLPDGKHIGLCGDCRQEVEAILRFSSEMQRMTQEALEAQ